MSPCTYSDLPEPNHGQQYAGSYLVLLQVGFTLPLCVTTGAVRSYRTISPLPHHLRYTAVYFLLHLPWAHAPQELPGTLPSGARTFLCYPFTKNGNSDYLVDSQTLA